MDTGSHLLFGSTLAGLAMLQPEVASDSSLTAAVLAASLIGSHAPDLDSVLKLKSNDLYWKHHRSWSHSVPAWLGWAGAIGSAVCWGFGAWGHAWLVYGIALLAVAMHVLLDWTNAYGVQMLLPFRRDWQHLDAICLTDPLLLVLHGAIGVGWLSGLWPDPGLACAYGWALTAAYVGWRIVHHEIALRRLRRKYRRLLAAHLLPGLWWFRWQYVVQTDEGYEMGWVRGKNTVPVRKLPFAETHACVDATRKLRTVEALQRFAKREYVVWTQEEDGGYRVVWTDLRFWQEREWPYKAQVRLDGQLNVKEQMLGWRKRAWDYPYV